MADISAQERETAEKKGQALPGGRAWNVQESRLMIFATVYEHDNEVAYIHDQFLSLCGYMSPTL